MVGITPLPYVLESRALARTTLLNHTFPHVSKHRWTFGPAVRSLLKWLLGCHLFLGIQRLIRSLRSSGMSLAVQLLTCFEPDLVILCVRLLGTPTTEIWPGLTQMPDFKTTFPRWAPQSLPEILPEMDERALHLLKAMLTYDPPYRISGMFFSLLLLSCLSYFSCKLREKTRC